MKRVASEQHLSTQQWGQVVVVAGIGTVLEWFDFYSYAQLNATLEKVFFPTSNETIQALSFWGVYAAAFVVRPIGALIFGHIGDTVGRNRCLLLSILAMAFSTIAIGILPTYDTGVYKAGIAAPVLLALLRLLQGLAMGGEFGSAVIYISELAERHRRGTFVAILQMSVNAGMIIATLLVMLLQNTLSTDAMLNWGWRVPFLCASATALLGAFLRRGMPEPHAFLAAARAARLEAERAAAGGAAPAAPGAAAVAAKDVIDVEVPEVDAADQDGVSVAATDATAPHGLLEGLHGHSNVRTPILRLVRNNSLGLFLHVCFMAWVSGAFYTTVSWLAKDLRTYGYPLLMTQGILIVSLIPNAVGLFAIGFAIDHGVPALLSNAVLTAVGSALGFAVFWGVGRSLAVAWGLTALFHFVIGGAMANVALPCTRIYEPLSRTTGFSFGYNFGYGVLGGLSPLAVSAIKANLPAASYAFAPAIWLLCLGAISIFGCVGLRMYQPRLGRPYVGKIE
ncbi:MAG: major facilitator superfamily domain-containing protein [Monoraphidium minutum]|nr:MAG: major facilitator superfamily domain-containing protein [Monoraphidium minutum]